MSDSGHITFQDLLNNDIFVDFLNTFLNLPVFGQIPLYTLKDKCWELHPELPSHLSESVDGFLKWIEEYRLPHFLKTDLYLHFVLCELLLGIHVPILTGPKTAPSTQPSEASLSTLYFSEDSLDSGNSSTQAESSDIGLSPVPIVEATKKADTPDRWLLRRCIGSVRGMKRFRSFLMGTRGEELVEFWLRVDSLLKLDETDDSQRDQYFAQLRMLQAIHLQDGSVVMSTCGGFIDLPSPEPDQPYLTRRDFIAKLQERAMQKLQAYWLPRFLTHCKHCLRKVKECDHILQEYRGKVSKGELIKNTLSSAGLSMTIRQTEHVTEPYFTKASKRLLWRLPYCTGKQAKITTAGPSPSSSLKAKEQRDCSPGRSKVRALPKLSPPDLAKRHTLGCLCQSPSWAGSDVWRADAQGTSQEYVLPQPSGFIPVIKAPSMLLCRKFPERNRPFDYLHWAFNADRLAGEPFATFLAANGKLAALHYLRLWHEMSNFLNVVLSVKDRAGYLLRNILAEKIVEVYLKEGSKQYAKLQPETAKHLRLLLPSGRVMPWIFAAQKEICEILADAYDESLDQDDTNFLELVAGTKPNDPSTWTQCEGGPLPETDTDDPHVQRMARSLLLAQACSANGDTEILGEDDWKLLAMEDPTNLGSMQIFPKVLTKDIDIQGMTFEEIVLKHPKLAVQELSKNFKQYYKKLAPLGLINKGTLQRNLWKKLNMRCIRDGKLIITRPKLVPKNLEDVIMSQTSLLFFQRLLEAYDADTPLNFWKSMELFYTLHSEHARNAHFKWVLANFFNKNNKAEEFLQCNAPIIGVIQNKVDQGLPVTMNMLLLAQKEVVKALEQNWFGLYLQTYTVGVEEKIELTPALRSIQTISHLNHAWKELQRVIGLTIGFLRMTRNPEIRMLFENYLRDELYNDQENLTSSRLMTVVPSQASSFMQRGSGHGEETEMIQLKRRIVNGRPLIINYLVNDLHFCMEIQHYVWRAEAAILMVRMGMHDNIYEGLLRAKAEMIIKLFIQSDMPPRVRVNISDHEKDWIIMEVRHGKLDPSLFHTARMAVICPLLHFWKRFYHQNLLSIFGKPIIRWRKEYVSPNYVHPSFRDEFHKIIQQFGAEDFPILRFTLAKGIQLLMPNEKPKTSPAGSTVSTSGKVSIINQPHGTSVLGGKLSASQKEGKRRNSSIKESVL